MGDIHPQMVHIPHTQGKESPVAYGIRMLPMVWAELPLPGPRFTGKTQRRMPGLDKPFQTDKINCPAGFFWK